MIGTSISVALWSVMGSRHDELDEMKRIDFCQFAASCGFVIDRRQSSRSSAVLKHPCGDKLIVARQQNGHYVYFNAKGNDNGTIVDFIQSRERVSLGEVRKRLRPWLGRDPNRLPQTTNETTSLLPTEHDAARVLARWLQAQPITVTHPFLEMGRRIPRDVLTHPIFRDRIRTDSHRNALFPHFNQTGLCGFEVKNVNWTGFAAGGVKGLACSRPQAADIEMVVCETAIDMLSYAALFGVQGKRFFSTAGQISPLQSECLRSAIERMRPETTVILALDHDKGGEKLSRQIQEAIGVTGCSIREHFPSSTGDDWNDVLRRSTATPTPDSLPAP